QFAEPDIDAAAERDDQREPDACRRSKSEHRCADGARLRDQREASAACTAGADGCVESDACAYHAERMRSHEPNAARARHRENLGTRASSIGGSLRWRRKDERGLRAGACAFVENATHRGRWDRDQREIDRASDCCKRRIRALAENATMVGVDRKQRAVEIAIE